MGNGSGAFSAAPCGVGGAGGTLLFGSPFILSHYASFVRACHLRYFFAPFWGANLLARRAKIRFDGAKEAS